MTTTVPTTSQAPATTESRPPTTEPSPTTQAPTTTQASATSTASSTVPATDSEVLPPEILDAILLDAANLTVADIEQITVTSAVEMTFDDASLGCPEPGRLYAQVLTQGFQVIVEAGEAELDYRVDERTGAFKLCEQ